MIRQPAAGYSVEVEQALMQHPAIQACAVIGLPDPKWGERVTAVLPLHAGQAVDPEAVKAFVKERLGSVKAPKQVEIWPDLPRAKVAKVPNKEIRARLLPSDPEAPPNFLGPADQRLRIFSWR